MFKIMLNDQLSIQYDQRKIPFTVIITDIDENQCMSNLNRFISNFVENPQNFAMSLFPQIPSPPLTAPILTAVLYGRPLSK